MTRLLVADDETGVSRYITLVVERSLPGVEVVGVARNGLEALSLVESAHPDLVLMDIRMPVMDGLEATRIIRQRNPGLPVLLLTAHAEFEYARRALQLGAVDFLLKPISPSHLVAALRRVVPQPGARTARRSPAADGGRRGGPRHQVEGTVKQALEYIDHHYRRPITLEEVAGAVHVSAAYLSRLIRQQTGQTFVEYVSRVRIDAALWLLAASDLPVKEVARQVGVADPAYFALIFKKYQGISPSEHRARLGSSPGG